MRNAVFTILVPCYNEASRGNFRERVRQIMRYFGSFGDTEVIFINDGSRDDTIKILRREGVNYISNKGNRGKGFSLMHGARVSHGKYVVFMDADLAVDMVVFEKFRKAASPMTVCICERKNRLVNRSFIRTLASIIIQDTISILMPVGVADTQCGFKMFPRDALVYVLKYCKCTRWFLDIELLYALQESGYSIKTFPVYWQNKNESTLSVRSDSFRILLEFLDMLARKSHLRYKH